MVREQPFTQMINQRLKTLKEVPENLVSEIETLKILAPGLWQAGFIFLTIHQGKLTEMLKELATESSTDPGLRVELSETMLDFLREYQPKRSKTVEGLYMIESSPFPVFVKTTLDPSVDCKLMGLSKVIDTRDPVSMEELSFVDSTFWKNIYGMLRTVCVDVCPRGHAVSFETLCSFMNDDGWSHDEAGNIVKVKCPCCRMRFRIHDTVPLLCNFFVPIIEAEQMDTNKNRKTKDDQIETYFSTEDDEDEDLVELRALVLNQTREQDSAEDDEDNEEDDPTCIFSEPEEDSEDTEETE